MADRNKRAELQEARAVEEERLEVCALGLGIRGQRLLLCCVVLSE
jgi:hypothetical protein